jgi:hypothetical protein
LVNKPIRITVNWINGELPDEINKIQFTAKAGINLVPLDSSPRWLLAEKISVLSIEAFNDFDIKEIKLLNRENL